MKPAAHQLILTTVPDAEVAERIARSLVEARLAACVNVLPPVRSIYRWRGQIETAEERLLLIKARTEDYAAVERHIRGLHPYEVPEVIALSITQGLPAYLTWIDDPDREP
jgi:periplasmic divalent cation tolerance protein